MTYQVPPEALDSFHKHGYAVLERVIDRKTLEMLFMECGYFVGYIDSSMIENDIDVVGITHRGKRYFISNRYRFSPDLWKFLFGSLMESIVRAFLGNHDIYLFVEQWVVKGAEQGMKFAWHQDSGYVKFTDPETTHKPYLTCWCALDDMTAQNGTISVMPHERVGTLNHVVDHVRESGTNDLVGYEGRDPGVQLEVPAGSIVVFSSTSLHRSSANTTEKRRRAYLAQYSTEEIRHSSGRLWSQAVPFVKDGKNIYDMEKDRANTRESTSTKRQSS